DKLTIISGCLFLAANIFAITSITNPDWLDTRESVGALTVGLVGQRQTIHGPEGVCIPPQLPLEWVTTLEATIYVQRIAFTGMMLFCMAALIFPIGFYISEVGGQSYKLPNNTVVGLSYVLFVLSIFFTIVGLLCAAKFICQADECLKCLTLLLFFIFGE
uniref:Modulator of smoothened n=1 Tax=Rhinopithecus bieti TaxID=61621 RepID=A0A2K6MGE4_RHIBE